MFFKSLLPAFLWALFILIICGIPGQKLPHVDFLQWLKPDKIIHLVVYSILCYLLIKGFTKQGTFAAFRTNPKIWALVLSISYGILIEVLQEYVFIDRSGEIFDALANALGAGLGMLCFNLIRKNKFIDNIRR